MAASLDEPQGLGRPVGARRELGGALWRRSWLKALGLLLPPTGAFLAVYVAALVALFVSAFWTVDAFTGRLVHHWTTDNFHTLWHESTYRTVALRTIGIAAAVTVTDAIITVSAFPSSFVISVFPAGR